MTDFALLAVGFLAGGVVRLSLGTFIIYSPARGWVWRFSRFDEEDQKILDRLEYARESAHIEGWRRAYWEWRQTGEVSSAFPPEDT